MRLNLPRYHCMRFGVLGEFTATPRQDDDIREFVSQTATHYHESEEDAGEGSLVALFGSRSRVGGVTHQIRCSLSRQMNEDGPAYSLSITNHRVSEDLPAPPRRYRPVSAVIEVAAHLFGLVDVQCDAVFEYEQSLGFRSKVIYPIPLILHENGDGVTHIENAQFSRRESDDIQYRILVINSEDSESFVHSVRFESTTDLGRVGIRKLFDKARLISSQLLTRAGDS